MQEEYRSSSISCTSCCSSASEHCSYYDVPTGFAYTKCFADTDTVPNDLQAARNRTMAILQRSRWEDVRTLDNYRQELVEAKARISDIHEYISRYELAIALWEKLITQFAKENEVPKEE